MKLGEASLYVNGTYRPGIKNYRFAKREKIFFETVPPLLSGGAYKRRYDRGTGQGAFSGAGNGASHCARQSSAGVIARKKHSFFVVNSRAYDKRLNTQGRKVFTGQAAVFKSERGRASIGNQQRHGRNVLKHFSFAALVVIS